MVALTFGQNLRRLRMVHGSSQKDLAERAEITQSMLSRYEAGHDLPSTPTVIRLAKALGITTDELLRHFP